MMSNYARPEGDSSEVLLLRSIPLQRDSRSSKMAAAYASHGWQVTPLIWSRGEADDNDGAIVCTAKGGYGDRFKGLAARLRWMAFITREMIRHRRRYDVVHAVDFDTAIIAVPLGFLLRKPVVYDAFDSIGAILGEGRIANWLMVAERAFIRASAVAIFPDQIRLEQYGITSRENVTIISNVPDAVPGTAMTNDDVPAASGSRPLRCVYVGTLEARHRGLEYIAGICRALPGKVEFVVGGTGQLEPLLATQNNEIDNLQYVGRLDYGDALDLMRSADILYGPYLLSAPAHRYASPNKLYEHLMLGKPIITNTGIPPARVVEEARSGFLFDGSIESLKALLRELDEDACREAGKRARACWDERYATLRQRELQAFFEKFAARRRQRSLAATV